MNFTLTNNHLELDLGLTKASVTIVETDREDIELEFSELRRNTIDEIFDIAFQNETLSIKEKGWRKGPIPADFMSSNVSTDLEIRIPRKTKLRGSVSTLSGSIDAETLSFNGRVKTVSGSIRLGDVESSKLKAHSMVGSLTINTLRGGISAKMVSGSCAISDGVFTDVSITGVSGDITISGKFALKSNGAINTVSGGINMTVNEYEGDYLMGLSTLSGTIHCQGDYPKENVDIKKRMPFLKNHPFKNVMPDIKGFFSTFSKVMDDSETDSKSETEEATEEHVKTILDMVSEGKISAEEAEKLIKAIKE